MSDVLTLQGIQKAILEILVWFDAFCKKHDLDYVLYYGTLLGAVRHQGFIPWDDDIDVAMPRPDYERLLRLYYDEHVSLGDDRLYLLSGERDDEFAFAFAKILRRDTEILPESLLYHNDSDNLWIDIFPIDGFPSPEEQPAYLKKLGEYRTNIGRSITITGTRRGNESRLKSIARIPVALTYNAIGYRKFRDELIALAKSYPYETSEYVGLATWNDNSAGLIQPHDAFAKRTTLPFEGYEFPVSADYENYLRNRYGNDYMELPPEDKRESHYIQARMK